MDMSGDDRVQLALKRAEEAVRLLQYDVLVAGPTKSSLFNAYDQLHTASEHLCDAGYELGIGDIRR